MVREFQNFFFFFYKRGLRKDVVLILSESRTQGCLKFKVCSNSNLESSLRKISNQEMTCPRIKLRVQIIQMDLLFVT